MRKSQLSNYYGNNERPMSNGDPRIFELPCRFPAAPSIRPESRAQDFDQKGLSIWGDPRKIFTLSFPTRQGKGELGYSRKNGEGRMIGFEVLARDGAARRGRLVT